MISLNKYYKSSCNNEILHISCLLFIASFKVSTVTGCIKLTLAEQSNNERPMAIIIDLKDQLWKEPKQNSACYK